MDWGLGLRSRLLIAAGVTLFMYTHAPAKAADLGGDCCADLEERVAELEATTARKGNKKVSVEVYGKVNKDVLWWDDGVEKNTYVEDNGYQTTRFGFRGKAKIVDDWNGGFRLEWETRIARSRNLDQLDDDNTDDTESLLTRHSYIYLNNKKYGELRVGLTSSPKDNINKDTHVAGVAVIDTETQDFFFNNDFFLRSKLVAPGQSLAAGSAGLSASAAGTTALRWQDLERCYSSSSALFDCSTRRNMVVWESSKWFGSKEGNGLSTMWGWGEDDIWSGAVRYTDEWDIWKVGADVAYEKFTDERVNNAGGGLAGFRQDLNEWGGEASLLHKPTGLFGQFAFTTSENDSSNAHGVFTGKSLPTEFAWDVSVGIQKKWWDIGNTTLWGGYTKVTGVVGFNLSSPTQVGLLKANSFPGIPFNTEVTDSEVTKWYLTLNQEVVPGLVHLYLGYQHIEGELDLVDKALNPVAAPFHDFDLVFSGARIYF
jgi:predicted porin